MTIFGDRTYKEVINEVITVGPSKKIRASLSSVEETEETSSPSISPRKDTVSRRPSTTKRENFHQELNPVRP